MNKVIFSYYNNNYFVQCNNNDKFDYIISKFLCKFQKSKNNFTFLFNGKEINEELSFDECANNSNGNNNIINIVVKDEKDNKTSEIEDNDEQENIPINDKYENFSLNQMKELCCYEALNDIEMILCLNDGRILTIQSIHDDDGEDQYKLYVYSIKKNRFECDINIDFEKNIDLLQMNDGNILIIFYDQIKVVKINKNSIEEISFEKKKSSEIKKLLNENLLIKALADKQPPQKAGGFFANILYKPAYDKYLYKNEKGKLICYKNLNQLYNNENIIDFCQITDDEYIFTTVKKGLVYGKNNYLSFYDMKGNKKIKTLKLGDAEKSYKNLFLLNKDNIIVSGNNSIILVGIKNKAIIKIFNYYIYLDDCISLNENSFLFLDNHLLNLYVFEEPNNIRLKEEKKINNSKVLKLRGDKLICHNYRNKILIYGCN